MKKLLHTVLAAIMLQGIAVNATAQMQEENSDTTLSTIARYGQEIDLLKRIKVSGYIQGQFQVADSAGQASFAGGNFPTGVDKRFALRRARVKFQYDGQVNEKGWSTSQYVFNVDVTEKGVAIKDMYAKITDPWSGWVSLTVGMQNRPFGYEIGYSSSLRESPERGRMSQIIFPGERDLGAMITLQGPKTGKWNWLKLEAGMFNGTGARGAGLDASDWDKKKDFIGHLSIAKSTPSEKIKYGLGVSYYGGGVRQDKAHSYKYGTDSLGAKGFIIDIDSSKVAPGISARKSLDRTYIGVDAQFSIDWLIGLTTIRGEYIQGLQPGTSSSTASFVAAPPTTTTTTPKTIIVLDTLGNPQTITTGSTSVTSDGNIYSRNFNGAYFYFTQNIGNSPWQAIVKYDWYDPNTDVKGNEIGEKLKSSSTLPTKNTGAADLKYETWGFGLAYRWDANVKITAYYDMVKNETTNASTTTSGKTTFNVPGYQKDLKDNVFTLRLQIKF